VHAQIALHAPSALVHTTFQFGDTAQVHALIALHAPSALHATCDWL
jgi:hypothetical protein